MRNFLLIGAILIVGSSLASVSSAHMLGVSNDRGIVNEFEGILNEVVAGMNVREEQSSLAAVQIGVPFLPLLPPLWHTGDTHAHIQLCGPAGTPDMTPEELLDRQRESETQVTFAQIWGGSFPDLQNFISNYVPLVTGYEDPVSQTDPDYILQFGVEVSHFPSDQFGHINCAGISNATFPFDAKYPKPILDFCHAQANAITGYGHVFWPLNYNVNQIQFYPNYGVMGPMAPTDIALGKADYIETLLIRNTLFEIDWRGMYYKLLNAGLRPSVSAGRDNSCVAGPWNHTTIARIANEPLTFNDWTRAIKAGRTSISEGKKFLNMTVDDAEIGGQATLSSPGMVDVNIRLVVAEDHEGEIVILRDGIPLSVTYPYSLSAGEEFLVDASVQMDESGWISAHAQGLDTNDAHTGAVYVVVNNQPICKALDAGYWSDYSTAFASSLSQYDLDPSDIPEVAQHILEGKKIFDALNACALPPPQGVSRYGTSVPACKGPIQINVRDLPTTENPNFAITNINAPASAAGWLVVGTQSTNRGPIFAKGAELLIDPNSIISILPVFSNGGGYHQLPIQFPSSASGVTLYFQYFWQNMPGCGSLTSGLSASDALSVTIQ